MAWYNPATWFTVGQIVTKSDLDSLVRDNLRYLKGESGVFTLQSGVVIDDTLGTEFFKLPPHTTAQIGTALATTTGRMGYDETVQRIKFYDGTAIRAVVSSADVHDTPVNGSTQNPVSSNWAFDYQNIVTATGDMRYATAAGVETRLPIGAALQILRTNTGTTAPEWATVSMLVGHTYPSDNLQSSNDTERTTTSTVYVKKKEIKVNEALDTIRIKYDLKNQTTGYTTIGRIYKNGVGIGTENAIGDTYTTFSEDITNRFAVNDLLQIYLKTDNAAHAAYVKNLRLYYSNDPTLSVTNQDP